MPTKKSERAASARYGGGTYYADVIVWIATHEPHAEHNSLMAAGDPLCAEIVETYSTVALASDLYGVDAPIVAADVCREYKKLQRRKPIRSVADVRRERAFQQACGICARTEAQHDGTEAHRFQRRAV